VRFYLWLMNFMSSIFGGMVGDGELCRFVMSWWEVLFSWVVVCVLVW